MSPRTAPARPSRDEVAQSRTDPSKPAREPSGANRASGFPAPERAGHRGPGPGSRPGAYAQKKIALDPAESSAI
ncbi:hypothetical protein ACPXCP_19510 [Streptomyces sp. DT20]|uniref:hypothetical protein n=1 Tax=Streptomyces sp. DT20 TaxID=3416519 RepID=UPI003CEBE265